MPITRRGLIAASLMLPIGGRALAQDALPPLPATLDPATLGVAPDPALRSLLPARLRDAGVIPVSTTAYTPPITFLGADNREIIGVCADLVRCFATLLGARLEMTDLGSFAAVIPTLRARRFEMSISGMGGTVERERELDMIGYMYDGKTIMVRRGNPRGIASMGDLCGTTVAVGVGTVQEALVRDQAVRCGGRLTVLSIPRQPDVLMAVRTGRADATVGGYATAVYTTRYQIQNGFGLDALPEVRFDVGYNTIAFTKDNAQLRDAILASLQRLIDIRAYHAVMERWGLANLAVPAARLNDAGSLAAGG